MCIVHYEFRRYNFCAITLFQLTSGLPKIDYFLLVIQIYNSWYIFWEPSGSTSKSEGKNKKLKKIQVFIAKSSYFTKSVQKTKISQNMTSFQSPWPKCVWKKLTLCKFPKGDWAKNYAKYRCKSCAICFLVL